MNALPGLEKHFIFGVYIPDPPLGSILINLVGGMFTWFMFHNR
jgi:hypothetical protein